MVETEKEYMRWIMVVRGFIGQSTSEDGISLDELVHKCRESNLTIDQVKTSIRALHVGCVIYCPKHERYALVDRGARLERRGYP